MRDTAVGRSYRAGEGSKRKFINSDVFKSGGYFERESLEVVQEREMPG